MSDSVSDKVTYCIVTYCIELFWTAKNHILTWLAFQHKLSQFTNIKDESCNRCCNLPFFGGETFVNFLFLGVDGLASLERYIRERVSLSEKEYIFTYPADEDLQITRFPAFMKIL